MAPPPLPTAAVTTPEGSHGVVAGLLAGPTLPGLAARIGAALAARRGSPWRFGRTVVAARHQDVSDLLARDLDFLIGPVNATRIEEVNGPFVLGMDRGGALPREREALYRALAAVDLEAVLAPAAREAEERLDASGSAIDAVADYARPVAAHTAQRLFGIVADDDRLFMDVTRAVFAHTFLNLGGDPVVRERAIRAAALMKEWIVSAIAQRRTLPDERQPKDMLGALLTQRLLDDEGVRRTLGGMLVGAVDTTASAVAKIMVVLGQDAGLRRHCSADLNDPRRLRGWCWEALRRWPHNPILLRTAAADTMLGGTAVREGDRVIAWTQAAMLDAALFPAPRQMRPDRDESAYLHFGGMLHVCAGRRLNGHQIPLLVGALLRRGVSTVTKLRWAGPFPAHLEVRFA